MSGLSRIAATASIAGAMIALSAGNALGGVVFSDSTFNLANYLTTAPFESPAGTTIVVSQCASCGHPGSALQVTATFPIDGNAAIGIVNQTFAYDPGTQGPILSITASVDKLLMDQADQSGSATFTNTFRP